MFTPYETAKKIFQSHALIELAVIAALIAFMLVVDAEAIGNDLAVTTAGTGLMILATCWTLNTLRDGLVFMACRARCC